MQHLNAVEQKLKKRPSQINLNAQFLPPEEEEANLGSHQKSKFKQKRSLSSGKKLHNANAS